MAETRRLIFKNIIGDTKATIDAIQKFISENSFNKTAKDVQSEIEEAPAESINRILNSTVCQDTNAEIQEIIKRL